MTLPSPRKKLRCHGSAGGSAQKRVFIFWFLTASPQKGDAMYATRSNVLRVTGWAKPESFAPGAYGNRYFVNKKPSVYKAPPPRVSRRG